MEYKVFAFLLCLFSMTCHANDDDGHNEIMIIWISYIVMIIMLLLVLLLSVVFKRVISDGGILAW